MPTSSPATVAGCSRAWGRCRPADSASGREQPSLSARRPPRAGNTRGGSRPRTVSPARSWRARSRAPVGAAGSGRFGGRRSVGGRGPSRHRPERVHRAGVAQARAGGAIDAPGSGLGARAAPRSSGPARIGRGRPLYERLGFVATNEMRFADALVLTSSPTPPHMRPHLAAFLAALALLPSVAAAQAGPKFINPPGLAHPNGYTHVVVSADGRLHRRPGGLRQQRAGRGHR